MNPVLPILSLRAFRAFRAFRAISHALLWLLAVLLASCAPSSTTTVTAPDGTVTRTETRGGVDPDSFALGAGILREFTPRAPAAQVRREK